VRSLTPLGGEVDADADEKGATTNATLQQAVANVVGQGSLPPFVELMVGGHLHTFQSITFAAAAARPPQLVVGISGVALSNGPTGSFNFDFGDDPVVGYGANLHGVVQVDYHADGSWEGKATDPDKSIDFAKCDSRNPPESLCGAP
jgi:hypothetical protein